jgi:hypothetical protein
MYNATLDIVFELINIPTGYESLLRGGIAQSISCNCDDFLIYCAPYLSSNHSRFIHQISLLWMQPETPTSEAGGGGGDRVRNGFGILPISTYYTSRVL